MSITSTPLPCTGVIVVSAHESLSLGNPPSDLQAARLLAHLECREQIRSTTRRTWTTYQTHLRGWPEAHGIRLPTVPDHREQSSQFSHLMMSSLQQRQALIARLRAAGILSVFHYVPLHLSEIGKGFGGRPGDSPVTESVTHPRLRLPFCYDLSEADQARLVDAILDSGGA